MAMGRGGGLVPLQVDGEELLTFPPLDVVDYVLAGQRNAHERAVHAHPLYKNRSLPRLVHGGSAWPVASSWPRRSEY